MNVPLRYERKLLKGCLLFHLHTIFSDSFQPVIQSSLNNNNNQMECYSMDSKMTQLLIQGIVESGEYTLEGIAFHTRIPFDVIYDAACGISNQVSITPWARIAALYLQVKPDVAQLLTDRLIKAKEKNNSLLPLLGEG